MRDKARKNLAATRGSESRVSYVLSFVLSFALLILNALISNYLPDTVTFSTVMLTISAGCAFLGMLNAGAHLIRLG